MELAKFLKHSFDRPKSVKCEEVKAPNAHIGIQNMTNDSDCQAMEELSNHIVVGFSTLRLGTLQLIEFFA